MTNEEWYTCTKRGEYKLTDKAHEEAKESYKEYMELQKEYKKMGIDI